MLVDHQKCTIPFLVLFINWYAIYVPHYQLCLWCNLLLLELRNLNQEWKWSTPIILLRLANTSTSKNLAVTVRLILLLLVTTFSHISKTHKKFSPRNRKFWKIRSTTKRCAIRQLFEQNIVLLFSARFIRSVYEAPASARHGTIIPPMGSSDFGKWSLTKFSS